MKKLSLLAAFMMAFTFAHSQKFVEGAKDFKFLKGQTKINIEYDYENLHVWKRNQTEEEYVGIKVKEKNEKQAGTGDTWKVNWEKAREERYKPKFEELFNKVLEKASVTAGAGVSGAKYTLIVKTTFIYPGYNIGISKMPSYVDFEFIWVETDNKDKVITKQLMKNAQGSQMMGFDFDIPTRVAESYAIGGKRLAALVWKKGLK